ncbi:MAG: neutral/alkaline non-lysosomal ceramidase N-terminal domain-containing protein [Polyangiales bacterium]
MPTSTSPTVSQRSADLYDVIVVGGGFAGVTAAVELCATKRVLLLEASDRLGGRARTVPVGDGVKADVGAHYFGVKHRRVSALVRRLGLEHEVIDYVKSFGPDPAAVSDFAAGRSVYRVSDTYFSIQGIDARAPWGEQARFLTALYAVTALCHAVDGRRPERSLFATSLDAVTYEDLVDRLDPPGWFRELMIAGAEGVWSQRGDRMSLLYFLWYLKNNGGFSDIFNDPRFTEGREVKTTRATLGLAMALGTDEGPGPLHGARWALGLLRDRRANAVDPKVPFIDLGLAAKGRVLDRWRSDHPWMHSLPLPAMRDFRALAAHGALGDEWVPSVVPVQVVRLGPLAVVALPCEPSVVAGRRPRATALRAMGEGAREVVVNGYANAYCSYLVTAEEYGAQSYEGGCTLFGPWTLALYQTEVAALAAAVAKDDVDVGCGAEPPPTDLRQLGLGRYRPRLG